MQMFTSTFTAVALASFEGIVTFVLLERGGYDRKKAALYAFLAAALSTPLGTLLSFPLVGAITRSTLGILLALSAGALIYVGATHLLPEVERENRRYTTFLALAAGVLVATFIVLSKA
jgi:zinc and cadmium transporter